jgi:uroporphyrinogen-III synthase
MSSDRPRTVVVTRAAAQSAGLTDRLERVGYRVLEVPVIQIAEPADGGAALGAALARLDSYDWLVVTSPNGAARVRDAYSSLPVGRRPRLAAVGPGTAAALGVPVDLVATDSVGEGLVAEMPAGSGHVLLAQAEAARDVVRSGLERLGWGVDAVIAYRTVRVDVSPELIRAASSADGIVFTSGSTIRAYLDAAGSDGLPPVVVSIGPATSRVAEELGVRVTVTAAVHNLDGLVDAVQSVLPPVGG